MKEIHAQYFVSDDLQHSVNFHSLYHNEIKDIIKYATERFGKPLNTCKNEECDCKISKIYPEIMTSNGFEKVFVCPFCYKENVYNDDWGYTISANTNDIRTSIGYKLVVYFRNMEDACLFYMFHSPKYSKYMELFLKEDH
jgi:hypothetical protein